MSIRSRDLQHEMAKKLGCPPSDLEQILEKANALLEKLSKKLQEATKPKKTRKKKGD